MRLSVSILTLACAYITFASSQAHIPNPTSKPMCEKPPQNRSTQTHKRRHRNLDSLVRMFNYERFLNFHETIRKSIYGSIEHGGRDSGGVEMKHVFLGHHSFGTVGIPYILPYRGKKQPHQITETRRNGHTRQPANTIPNPGNRATPQCGANETAARGQSNRCAKRVVLPATN